MTRSPIRSDLRAEDLDMDKPLSIAAYALSRARYRSLRYHSLAGPTGPAVHGAVLAFRQVASAILHGHAAGVLTQVLLEDRLRESCTPDQAKLFFEED